MFVIWLPTCCWSPPFLLWFWMKSTRPWTTVRTASNPLANCSHVGAGASISAKQQALKIHTIMFLWMYNGCTGKCVSRAGRQGPTWAGVDVGQQLQMGSEAVEIGWISGSLKGNGEFLNTLSKWCWCLQLKHTKPHKHILHIQNQHVFVHDVTFATPKMRSLHREGCYWRI